ncbi:MAG: serine/threonine protein kinase [Candidatus Obscuribacterales bacterium]
MTDSYSDWFQRYKWCEPIAQGGMGVVYLAEDRNDRNSKCVIKQLRSDTEDHEELKEAMRLFKREAQLLKELEHAGIVTFFDDHATADGAYFLVMDYVPGNNLETIIQNYGPFSQDDAVKVGIQICEVLEYLHEREPPIIYRDLKPSNLMLTPEGQIIFIDFGIAKVFMPKDSATRVVTAGYSPPEQYFGKPQTKSDLSALGATLSHLLTGVRPRPLLTCVPSQQVPELLPTLDSLITELTAHSPEDRPATARLVRHRLYRIYQEIHPDFDIPEEVLAGAQGGGEEQYISQKIMASGLKAAKSESLPQARGAESEVYSDEDMPTGIKKLFDDLQQHLSSSRNPVYKPESDIKESTTRTSGRHRTGSLSRPAPRSSARPSTSSEPESIWQRFINWVTGKS